jgi:hypothetical protein
VNANDIVLWVVVACVAFLIGNNRAAGLTFGPESGRTDRMFALSGEDIRLVSYRRWLAKFIERSYGMDEINILAFDMGINYEQLSGDTIGERAREFVIHCERGGMIPQMLDALKLRRT